MLRKIIAGIFSSSIEVLLWFNLALFTFGGGFIFYNYAENTHFAPLALLGGVLGLILGMITDVFIGGFICILLDIHNSLHNVESLLIDMNARDDLRGIAPPQYLSNGYPQLDASGAPVNYGDGQMVIPAAGDAGSVNFPRVVECPSCQVELKIIHPGRFRCSKCNEVFTADANGSILFNE